MNAMYLREGAEISAADTHAVPGSQGGERNPLMRTCEVGRHRHFSGDPPYLA